MWSKKNKDIKYVNKFKPEYIGFVFAKVVDKFHMIWQLLLKSLSNDIKTVGVFVNHEIDDIISLMNED